MDEMLLADTPLIDPKDDRLGFAPFAENLAKAISKIETNECLVFALFGPWGSGKTTCMYLVDFFSGPYLAYFPISVQSFSKLSCRQRRSIYFVL